MDKKDCAVQLKKEINRLIAIQKFDDIKKVLLFHKEITEHDNALALICCLCAVYEHEKNEEKATVFSKVHNIDELLERCTTLKFYLRRIDFDIMDDPDIFYRFLFQNKISLYELLCAVDFCVVHKNKVLEVIKSKGPDKLQNDNKTNMSNDNNGNMEEFCFIICTNDEALSVECIYYIEHLIVPEGIWINILTVKEARSMTAGYNEAMQYSKAKYKVYLHQDTFIVNPCFIKDCLDIFRNNPKIGLIGNIGVRTMPDSGIMWEADRYGMVYEQHIYETKLLSNAIDSEQGYIEVDAIDGFLMATQYDVFWREDLFTGWDFYDCSQSMEFIRKGYQVVIPDMKEPWCVHDCGFVNLDNFDGERKKYIEEYIRNK